MSCVTLGDRCCHRESPAHPKPKHALVWEGRGQGRPAEALVQDEAGAMAPGLVPQFPRDPLQDLS